MSVYVDSMRAPFGRLILCHMIADCALELHAMAISIGIPSKYYQHDHYDIALTKRAQAVKLGAREITWRQCAAMVANRRAIGILGSPEKAEAVLRARMAQRRKVAP